jgi:hypothetical protein
LQWERESFQDYLLIFWLITQLCLFNSVQPAPVDTLAAQSGGEFNRERREKTRKGRDSSTEGREGCEGLEGRSGGNLAEQ